MKFNKNNSNNKDKDSKSVGSNSSADKASTKIASNTKEITGDIMNEDPKPIDFSTGKDQGLDSLNASASDIASASHKSSVPSKASDANNNKASNYHPSHGNKNHGYGKGKRDFKDHKGDFKKNKTPKPIEPDQSTKEVVTVADVMGKFLGTRTDRTINEYTTPNSQQLSLLGVTNAAAGINWQIVNDITKLYYANAFGAAGNGNPANAPGANSQNITANIQNTLRATVDTINNLFYTKHPFLIGGAKLFDNAFTQSFTNTQQRLREINTGILNYAYRNTLTNDYQPLRQQGQENSIYPYSSLPENIHSSLPLLPDQIDDIQLFSLDGGAFLKSTNHLTQVPQDGFAAHFGYDTYAMPGIPGFNHYATAADIDAGLLTASHIDARHYVDRQFIYDGDNFTSNTGALAFLQAAGLPALGADVDNASIIHFRHDYSDVWNDLNNLFARPVNQNVEEENFMTYPDYNYAVIQSDFQKMFKAMRTLTQTAVDDADLGQLIGITDEQAFYNAVQSGIHFGTFFRCLLYSFGLTYSNGAFVKSKLGSLCFNDTIMRNMSIAKFKACQQFFDCLANILPSLPYNKYSFDNFKIWFNTSMSQKDKNAFDENNPVYSIRAIFCGMSDIMTFACRPHDTEAHRVNNYTPTEFAAEVNPILGNFTDAITDVFHTVQNVFGYRVKTLARQSTMFVPHGDALANFFARFEQYIFINRPWVDNRHPLNPLSGSLTTILDPLNFTGFITNFITQPNAIGMMCDWVRSYSKLVAPFYTLVKRISDNCSTVRFDDAVDYMKPSFNPETIVPGYKQHIVDYFQNSPRLMRFNLALRATVENDIRETIGEDGTVVCLSSHRPTVGFQPPRFGLDAFNGDALAHVSTPRLGFELPKNGEFYDFGTIGTQLYNVANPWATGARPYQDNALNLDAEINGRPNPLTDLVNAHAAQFLADNPNNGYFLSGGDIDDPFDLYQLFWYPGFWHMPYYQRRHRYITPVYDRPLQLDQHVNETDFMNGNYAQVPADFDLFADVNNMDRMHFFAYDFVDHQPFGNPTYREYREIFQVYRHVPALDAAGDAADFLELYPAATSMRLSYGSGNHLLVNDDQWVSPNVVGNYTHSSLSTRQNAVSIFTAFNMLCYGLPTSRNNIQYSALHATETLYRETIYDNFSKSLGIPYQPFLSLSVGASLYLDQVLTYVPTFSMRAYCSDVDLSTKFYNVLANITTLQSGLYNGEAYPSSDGWGVDQLTYPEKINRNEWYDKFTAEQAKKQVSNI